MVVGWSGLSKHSEQESFRRDLLKVETDVKTFMANSTLPSYLNTVYLAYIDTIDTDCEDGNLDYLTDRIDAHETLYTRADNIRSEVLQRYGVGKPWEETDKVCRCIRDVVRALEDVLCYALSDRSELVEKYEHGGLLFQSPS